MQLIGTLITIVLAVLGGFGYNTKQNQKWFKRLQDRVESLQKKLDMTVDQATCCERRDHYVTAISFQEQISQLTLSIQRLTQILESKNEVRVACLFYIVVWVSVILCALWLYCIAAAEVADSCLANNTVEQRQHTQHIELDKSGLLDRVQNT